MKDFGTSTPIDYEIHKGFIYLFIYYNWYLYNWYLFQLVRWKKNIYRKSDNNRTQKTKPITHYFKPKSYTTAPPPGRFTELPVTSV